MIVTGVVNLVGSLERLECRSTTYSGTLLRHVEMLPMATRIQQTEQHTHALFKKRIVEAAT